MAPVPRREYTDNKVLDLCFVYKRRLVAPNMVCFDIFRGKRWMWTNLQGGVHIEFKCWIQFSNLQENNDEFVQ